MTTRNQENEQAAPQQPCIISSISLLPPFIRARCVRSDVSQKNFPMSEIEEQKPGSSVRWKPILATAFVTGIVTVLTTLVIGKFQSKTPRLEFESTTGLVLEVQNEKQAIYNVRIFNSGQKMLDNVRAVISVPDADIRSHQVDAPPTLEKTITVSPGAINLTSPAVNPGENISVSFLLAASKGLPDTPKVTLRADGVQGVEREEPKEESGFKKFLWPSLVAAYLSVGTLLAFRLRFMRSRSRTLRSLVIGASRGMDGESHSDDQRHVLAYVLGANGYVDQAHDLLHRSDSSSYWAEVDFLTNSTLASENKENSKRLINTLKALLEYASIAPVSQGIIHFNLAKLYAREGDPVEAALHVKEAKSLVPKLISTRSKIDPNFPAGLKIDDKKDG